MKWNDYINAIDCLKELHIRLLHNDKYVQEAVSNLNADTRKLIKDMEGTQGFLNAAIYIVDDIGTMENEDLKQELTCNLFGTCAEDIA